MASNRVLWNKAGKFISGIVILCFFLPFFGVSCDGMDVITVSGGDLVGGCKPGGMITAMDDDPGQQAMTGGELTAKVDDVDREPLAIVAFAAVVLAFGLSWLRRDRRALIGAFVLSLVALGALVGLYVKVGRDLETAVAAETQHESKAGFAKEVEVDAGGRFGLWASCLGLLGMAVLTGLALRDKGLPAAAASPPPPPA